MKRFGITIVLTLATIAPAIANPALAKKRNCMACHTVEKKVVGPSFKDVAARYANQADASDALATKIMKGGRGSWGAVPMPANPQVSEIEAKQLATWALSFK